MIKKYNTQDNQIQDNDFIYDPEKIHVLDITYDDFINYKKPSTVIASPFCDFKCNKLNNKIVCHNYEMRDISPVYIKIDDIIKRYKTNKLISSAIVFAGFEPLSLIPEIGTSIKLLDSRLQKLNWIRNNENANLIEINELLNFLYKFRFEYDLKDDVVIYSGYDKKELSSSNYNVLKLLSYYCEPQASGNIIIKYGRFIDKHKPHMDNILGVKLASDNQYAEILNYYK